MGTSILTSGGRVVQSEGIRHVVGIAESVTGLTRCPFPQADSHPPAV